MTLEELRQKLTARLDAMLASWFVGREDRAYLTGVRAYVAAMTDAELGRLKGFMP